MAKFLFIYRNAAALDQAPPSPEMMQEILATWGKWLEQVAKNGNLVDGGDGLQGTGKIVRPGGIVSDGPFIESKEWLIGFYLVDCESEANALARAKQICNDPFHAIEVRPVDWRWRA